jgi:hypothetical protein
MYDSVFSPLKLVGKSIASRTTSGRFICLRALIDPLTGILVIAPIFPPCTECPGVTSLSCRAPKIHLMSIARYKCVPDIKNCLVFGSPIVMEKSWQYILSVGALLCTITWLYIWRPSRGLPFPPGPKGLPIIGNLLDMPSTCQWLTFDRWCKQYGMFESCLFRLQ